MLSSSDPLAPPKHCGRPEYKSKYGCGVGPIKNIRSLVRDAYVGNGAVAGSGGCVVEGYVEGGGCECVRQGGVGTDPISIRIHVSRSVHKIIRARRHGSISCKYGAIVIECN